MRKDIWKEFQTRFNIPQIGEFYAATEGNSGLFNLRNKFGAIGRLCPITVICTQIIAVLIVMERCYHKRNISMALWVPAIVTMVYIM